MVRYIIPTIVGVLYLVQGVIHLYNKEYGLGITWLAYAAANVGLILAMTEGAEGH